VSNKERNIDSLDEGRLVSLLKQGYEEAFRILLKRYEKKVFGIAYGITLDREESLEIVQEVFLKVYQKINSFREEAGLSTWIHRITVNQCLNWQRRWKRRFRWHHQPLEREGAGDYPESGTDEHCPETLIQKKELGKMLQEKLRELPEEARAVFVLKEVEGLSYHEISRVLNIKKGTVSSRLFYARQRLKESLKKYLDEEEIP